MDFVVGLTKYWFKSFFSLAPSLPRPNSHVRDPKSLRRQSNRCPTRVTVKYEDVFGSRMEVHSPLRCDDVATCHRSLWSQQLFAQSALTTILGRLIMPRCQFKWGLWILESKLKQKEHRFPQNWNWLQEEYFEKCSGHFKLIVYRPIGLERGVRGNVLPLAAYSSLPPFIYQFFVVA